MKKILIATAIAAIAVTSQASYLYWQIDGSEDTGGITGYTGARVFASTDNGATDRHYLTLGYGDFDTGNFVNCGTAVETPLNGSVVADVGAFANGSYSFYIELINYEAWTNAGGNSAPRESGFVAQTADSEANTYTSLVRSDFIGSDLSPVKMAVWHGGSYTTVPEPTSALLMLLGIAGLALKRRVA